MARNALPGVSGSNKSVFDRGQMVEGTIAAVGPGQAFGIWGPMNLIVWAEIASALTTADGSASASVASGTNISAGDTIVSDNVPYGTTVKTIAGANITMAFPIQTWFGTLSSGSTTVAMDANQPADLETLVGATVVNNDYIAAATTVSSADNDARTITLSAAPTSVPVAPGPVQIQFEPSANVITETGADAAAYFIGAATPIAATWQIERSFDGGRTWHVANIGGTGQQAIYANIGASMAFGDPEANMLYRVNCTVYTGTANVRVKYRISTTGQASSSIALQVI